MHFIWKNIFVVYGGGYILAMMKITLYFLRLNSKQKDQKLNIRYGDIQIKQHWKVKYLVCILDKTMSGEAMTISVINKINNKLKFLYRKNGFLTLFN